MKQSRPSRVGGFTLIELLVVIAIIGILASMLMPVYARARESARKIVCNSSLRQISMAIGMYADDQDECYPVAWVFWAPLNNLPIEPNLKTCTNSYVKNDAIWWCPSWKGVYGINAWGNPNGGSFDFIVPTSTLSNNVIGTPETSSTPATCYSRASISQPSDYPLIFCGSSWTSALNAHTGVNDAQFFSTNGIIGGTNIAYADGHTKWQTFDRNGWNTIISTPR